MTELNRRHNLATKPTMNNNGESYIVPFDIYKEGYDAYDISNWFKGRVGDNGTPFGIRWYKHGQLMDVTGMRPYLEGEVGDYTIDDSDPDNPKINMDSEASHVHVVGEVNDCQEYGVAIYRLINQAMPQAGIFYGKIGVMGVQDDGTTVMSSVDVVFKVLAGHMSMLGARKFYVSELEKALLDFKAKIKQHEQEYAALIKQHDQEFQNQVKKFNDDTQKVIDDARHTYESETKNAHDAAVAASQEIAAVRSDTKDLADQVGSQQNYISAHNIVTTDKFTNLSNDLTKYVTESFIQPEAFNNLNELKLTYPSGKKGICVAIDTGHFYVWQDNAWKDCGSFQSAGIANNSIYLEKLSTSLQNGFYPDVTEISVGNINSGYMSKVDGKIITRASAKAGDPVHTDNISVKPGEEYFVCTQNYWDGKAVIFKDQDKIISTLPVENDMQKKHIKITIPHNVNTLVLNGTRQFLPRLFKIQAYTQSLDSVTGVKTILKNQAFNYENVELTKNAIPGYWDVSNDGNYYPQPVDKTRANVSYVPIKVKPCEVYRVTGCSGWNARLWIIINAKGEAISSCKSIYSTGMTEEIMMPEGAAYLEVNELLLNTKTKVERATSIKKELPLAKKTWTALGDSWTQIFDKDKKSYVNDVAEITGVTAINSGGGGTGFLNGGPNNWNNQFYKHTVDANSDIVTVFGSFNDAYFANFKFGQEGDTGVDTMWGSLQHTLDHIYQNAFGAQVGIIAPGPWGAINQHLSADLKMSSIKTFADETVNAMPIKDFAEQYVKVLHDFAKLNSLPFLDLYHYSWLRPWDDKFINQYYHGESATDRTHPNATAMKLFIAPKIAKFIESFA